MPSKKETDQNRAEKDLESGKVDEILGFMEMIKKNLIGDRYALMVPKFYNVETYDPEHCPECNEPRTKFFFMLKPGDDLFRLDDPEPSVSGYQLFCLECTKKLKKKEQEGKDGGG